MKEKHLRVLNKYLQNVDNKDKQIINEVLEFIATNIVKNKSLVYNLSSEALKLIDEELERERQDSK